MPSTRAFADFCCELLSGVGACQPRRMFGGWGLSIDGLTIAIVADLGSGERLWLKADADTRSQFDAANCQRFAYSAGKGGKMEQRSMNYYSAPDEAMDAPHAMAPWARMALESALKARAATRKGAVATERAGSKRRPG